MAALISSVIFIYCRAELAAQSKAWDTAFLVSDLLY